MIQPGAVAPIDIFLWDDNAIVTSESVEVSIEDVLDGTMLQDNLSWAVGYNTLAMTELAGNAHLEGIYRYLFTTPSAPFRMYDWSVKHIHAASGFTFWKKGRVYVSPEVLAGTTEHIRIFGHDQETIYAGESANVSIRRASDGYYWNGSAFQAAYTTNIMDDLNDTFGTDHYEGVFEYQFEIPAGQIEVYDWSVKFEPSGWLQYFKGRICAIVA